MAISSKRRNPDNLESHSSIALSLLIFEVFVQIQQNVNLSLNQVLLKFLIYVKGTWMTQVIGVFFCKGLSSFNLKGFCCSYTCSSSLCESTISCCTRLITIKLCEFLFKFLSGFTSFRIFLLFPLSITLFVFMYSFSR